MQALKALNDSLRGGSPFDLSGADRAYGATPPGLGMTTSLAAGFTTPPGQGGLTSDADDSASPSPSGASVQLPQAASPVDVATMPTIGASQLTGFDPNSLVSDFTPYRGEASAARSPAASNTSSPTATPGASGDPELERDLAASRALITAQEGLGKNRSDRLVVYTDTTGHPTVGIGHKVVPADNLRVGDTISQDRADQLFQGDIARAVEAARSQAAQAGITDPAFIPSLASVNDQLGTAWRQGKHGWPKTWGMIAAGDYRRRQMR